MPNKEVTIGELMDNREGVAHLRDSGIRVTFLWQRVEVVREMADGNGSMIVRRWEHDLIVKETAKELWDQYVGAKDVSFLGKCKAFLNRLRGTSKNQVTPHK